MLTAVTFYDVVLFVHIFAVLLAFGPTYAYPVFLAVAERTDPRAVPAVGRGIATWDRFGVWMLLVILAGGLYLVADSSAWGFGDFYVSFGFLAVIVLGGLAGAFFAPNTRRLVEIAERDIAAADQAGKEVELSAEFRALSGRIGRVGAFAGVLVLVTVYVMTAKPFL